MVISQEGQDLIKHAVQAAIVVPVISCPVWHFLPYPAAMLAAEEQSRTDMCPTGPVGLLVSKALF